MAGKIFHLPAFVGADLLALNAAAGAGALGRAQLVDMSGYGKVFEVGKIPTSFAPLHAPKFFLRLGMRRNIVRVDRLVIQFLSEAEQQLGQIACRLQLIRMRPVVSLLVAIQLYLQTQIFDLQIVALTLKLGDQGLQSVFIVG